MQAVNPTGHDRDRNDRRHHHWTLDRWPADTLDIDFYNFDDGALTSEGRARIACAGKAWKGYEVGNDMLADD